MLFHHGLLCTDYKTPVLSSSASSVKSFKELRHSAAKQAVLHCHFSCRSAGTYAVQYSQQKKATTLKALPPWRGNLFLKCRSNIRNFPSSYLYITAISKTILALYSHRKYVEGTLKRTEHLET